MEDLKKKLEFVAEVVRKAEYELSQELDTHCDEELYAYNEALVEDLQKASGLLDEVKAPKVYVVFTEVVYDCEDSHEIGVFSSREKAMKEFREFVDRETKQAEHEGWIIDEGNTYFLSYDDGYYSQNRVGANVCEFELN